MSIYLIIDITIKKPRLYELYVQKVKPIVELFGGKYLVRGGTITPSAGDWDPQRIILIEFESLDLLQACFSSEDYREVAGLREGSTVSRSIIVEGVPQK